jgi:phage tail sheath gpL-like
VTASYVTTTNTIVTITHKTGSTRGNNTQFRAYWVTQTNQIRIATATSQFGLSISDDTVGGKLAGGTGTDNTFSALSAIANTRYHRIAIAHDDDTAITALRDQMDTMAATTSMLWQQAIAANVGSPAAAQTQAGTVNGKRMQIVNGEKCEFDTGEIAAQVAAARIAGDSVAAGLIVGEASDPACNLDGLQLKTIPMQWDPTDIPTPTEIETCLNFGVTVLVPSSTRPGFMQVARSITSYHKNGSIYTYAVLDTSNTTILDDCAERIRNDFTITFAGMKLASDPADGSPPKISNVVTPKGIRSRALFNLKTFESLGRIRDVDEHLSELVAIEHPTVPGRVDLEIPIEPIPGLHIIGGNVRQLS